MTDPAGQSDRRIGSVVAAALRECDLLALDRRHDLSVSFLIQTGGGRDAAFAIAARSAEAGWHTTLFGDATGWVVRLTDSARVTREWLAGGFASVDEIAGSSDADVRGWVIEDLAQPDTWDALASSVSGGDHRRDEEGAAASLTARQDRATRLAGSA